MESAKLMPGKQYGLYGELTSVTWWNSPGTGLRVRLNPIECYSGNVLHEPQREKEYLVICAPNDDSHQRICAVWSFFAVLKQYCPVQ